MLLVGFLWLILLLAGLLTLLFEEITWASLRATVLVLPQYSDVQQTVVVPVQARQLSSSSTRQHVTAATGKEQQPARWAAGILTFYNLATYAQTIPAGSVVTGADGVSVATDSVATVPAGNPPVEASVDIPAHAENSGGGGNIPPGDIKQVPCCANINLGGVVVSNTFPFSGGQDAQNYTVVSQRDVDAAASPLEAAAQQSAQESLQEQVHNLQLSPALQCTAAMRADPPVGSRAAQVAVTVTETCRGQAYSKASALQAAKDTMATKQLPVGYKLVLSAAQLTGVFLSRDGETFSCTVLVQERWIYQFSQRQLKSLALRLTGLSYAQAQATLQKEVGVRQGTIRLTRGDMLPTNSDQITILTAPVTQAFP